MIPKIIHYCWFGRKPLPESAVKCINSWKKYLPDYEIKEWNEDNFDVNVIRYTSEAYAAGKYAFVSDYVRFWVLYNYGGIYFDTDVEVIKNMSPIIEDGPYMGCELKDGTVNPGLGMGAEAYMEFFQIVLGNYQHLEFLNPDGSRNKYSMIPMVTELLRENGLKDASTIQHIMGLTIYPVEYFNPYNSVTGKLSKTENTYSIHWYDASWVRKQNICLKKMKQLVRRIISTFKTDVYH